jgi:hypothetical protein
MGMFGAVSLVNYSFFHFLELPKDCKPRSLTVGLLEVLVYLREQTLHSLGSLMSMAMKQLRLPRREWSGAETGQILSSMSSQD